MKTLIFHGNFESASDWEFARDRDDSSSVNVFPLWEFLRAEAPATAPEFVSKFLHQNPVCIYDCVVGYSLGGRILLHLIGAGWVPAKLCFISTNPGVMNDEDRAARIWHDLQWKEKVLTLPWGDVFAEWNAQPIFAADPPSDPGNFLQLEQYKPEIAHAFDIFSLGRMLDFSGCLRRLHDDVQIKWMVGEFDPKFVQLARNLESTIPTLDVVVVPNAGHRVHKSLAHSIAPQVHAQFFG